MICVCNDPNLDRTVVIPDVELGAGKRCGEAGEHFHMCWRPRGHTGRHWDGIHEDGGIVLVTAVWP